MAVACGHGLLFITSNSTQRGARTMALDRKNHNVYAVTAELGQPPVAAPENPRPRPTIVPNTFTILIFGR
jgi:hypothetical protein